LELNPHGLSRVIANALGSCIVDAPQLESQLVALLKPQARQQFADRSDSDEALVVAAALCLQGKAQYMLRRLRLRPMARSRLAGKPGS
jgi:hypothetical protein